MTLSQEDLDPEAWVLLGSIHRHAQGGPKPPDEAGAAFAEAYAKLLSLGLIERSRSGGGWRMTERGDDVLRARLGID